MIGTFELLIHAPYGRGVPEEISVKTKGGKEYIYTVHGWRRESSDMMTVFVQTT
ncbi:hypothetical protein M2277_004964 [Paenibacillus sp. LBL]|uniref:hypothetical protein n=1 Tax=Paenibacillus sp. LBL TaxID=2940563 RepID=UPI0024762CB7|nr:hypothetical protein [Paenibacillus sp. LBL]MDH6674272.1 hypothetical protein [Paenibacillus sp. LBL]